MKVKLQQCLTLGLLYAKHAAGLDLNQTANSTASYKFIGRTTEAVDAGDGQRPLKW